MGGEEEAGKKEGSSTVSCVQTAAIYIYLLLTGGVRDYRHQGRPDFRTGPFSRRAIRRAARGGG